MLCLLENPYCVAWSAFFRLLLYGFFLFQEIVIKLVELVVTLRDLSANDLEQLHVLIRQLNDDLVLLDLTFMVVEQLILFMTVLQELSIVILGVERLDNLSLLYV
jgi:hypothetical protein